MAGVYRYRGFTRHPPNLRRAEQLITAAYSPFIQKRLSQSQQQLFHKVLADYLRSFSGTLVKLKLCWLESSGPVPLLYHNEGLGILWPCLRELIVGEIASSDELLVTMQSSALTLHRVIVESKVDGIAGVFKDIPVWRKIPETLGQGSRVAAASLLELPNDTDGHASAGN